MSSEPDPLEPLRRDLSVDETVTAVLNGWPLRNEVVKGTVVRIVPFGLFLDIDGREGLVRIPEVSHRPIGHPSEAAAVGDEVVGVVTDVDLEREQVSVSLKRLLPDPLHAFARRAIGRTLPGRVDRTTRVGAFVEMDADGDGGTDGDGIVGLLPGAESVDLQVGDLVEVEVASIDIEARRVRLRRA
ncbi:S1 RNA-binding domain-containing protein [Nocardiopsis sp. RSe5-2]|uniref:S1 RNA-binding domain-containing protein n=1 Tax=Nocardiopsis endophytica TaxID=3018445 RepID=A0ABT4TWY1_9ACTN|nr:S1 RNA-binding domain-containing protein [Nocardiopsis endophytica]MDA2809197.1 S1 RNA-binding domain-containing protein [Nocardiopsis endophytica]